VALHIECHSVKQLLELLARQLQPA
jgi:hypothetical protein